MNSKNLFFAVIALMFFPETRGAMGSAARRAASTAAQRYLQTTPGPLAPIATPTFIQPQTPTTPLPAYQAPTRSFASSPNQQPSLGQLWRKNSAQSGVRYFSSRPSSFVVADVPPEEQLFIAVVDGNLQKVQSILKNHSLSKADLNTCLHAIASSRKKAAFSITDALLEAGADINAKTNGETPLHSAVRSHNLDMVSFLLTKNANRWEPDNHGKSPWDYADEIEPSAEKKEIGYFFSSSTNPEERTVTALRKAITTSNTKEVQRLLNRHEFAQHTLDAALSDTEEFSAPQDKIAIMDLLLRAGADYAQDPHNASVDERATIRQLLKGDKRSKIQKLHAAITNQDIPELEGLLESDTFSQLVLDDALFNVLKLGKTKNQIPVLELLVRAGADVNGRMHGRTPLHQAMTYKANPEVVEFLISKGAKKDALDRKGRSPLDIAREEMQNSPGKTAIEHLLHPTASAESPAIQTKNQTPKQESGALIHQLARLKAWWYGSNK